MALSRESQVGMYLTPHSHSVMSHFLVTMSSNASIKLELDPALGFNHILIVQPMWTLTTMPWGLWKSPHIPVWGLNWEQSQVRDIKGHWKRLRAPWGQPVQVAGCMHYQGGYWLQPVACWVPVRKKRAASAHLAASEFKFMCIKKQYISIGICNKSKNNSDIVNFG